MNSETAPFSPYSVTQPLWVGSWMDGWMDDLGFYIHLGP